MLQDKYGRVITYLRISVTDRCNLRCTYCMPAEGIVDRNRADLLSYAEIIAICRAGVAQGINKIRLTGGEPLLRQDLCQLVFGIAAIRGIEDIALTTNGLLLPLLAPELKRAGLRRVNISIDSLKPERYALITRGGSLDRAMAGLHAALVAGLSPVKINIVLQPGINDDEQANFQAFAHEYGVTLQYIQQMSLQKHVSLDDKSICLRPPDCRQCNRIRLTADGFMKPCLFSDIELDVRKLGAKQAILQAVEVKPGAGQYCYQREMVQIGG